MTTNAFGLLLGPIIVTSTLIVTSARAGAESFARKENIYSFFNPPVRTFELGDFTYPVIAVDTPELILIVHASPHKKPCAKRRGGSGAMVRPYSSWLREKNALRRNSNHSSVSSRPPPRSLSREIATA